MIKRFLILLIILGLGFFGYWLIDRQGAINLKEKIIHIFDKKVPAVPTIGTGSDNEYTATGTIFSGSIPEDTGLDLLYTGTLNSGKDSVPTTGIDEDFFDTTPILTGSTGVVTPSTTKEYIKATNTPKPVTTSTPKTSTKQYKNVLNALFE